MSEAISIDGNSKREPIDVYNELTLKLGHLSAVTTLIQSADPCYMPKLALNGVGYALEAMADGIRTCARELFEIGGAS